MTAEDRILKKSTPAALTLIDVKQLAMLAGKDIIDEHQVWEGKPVYRVTHETGLWTFEELKKRFLN